MEMSDYVNPFETVGGGWDDGVAAYSDGEDRYGGDDYEIVVVDTGVDKEHPALSGKVVAEACFGENWTYPNARVDSLCPDGATKTTAEGSGVACAMAGCGHGTMVAGAAAMRQTATIYSGQSVMVAGAAPNAKIISVMVMAKISNAYAVCESANPCARPVLSLVYEGLDHVIELAETRDRLVAVNISIGGGAYETVEECRGNSDYGSFYDAIETLKNLGVVTVIATGNMYSVANRGKIAYPACVENAVAVSATNNGGGAMASYAQNGGMTDFLAPGGSSAGMMVLPSAGAAGFAVTAGTSFAAPTVAGAYAVMRAKYPNAGVDELTEKLVDGAGAISDVNNGVVKPVIDVREALMVETEVVVAAEDLAGAITRGTTVGELMGGISSPYRAVLRLANGDIYYDRGPTPYRVAVAMANAGKLVGSGMKVQLMAMGVGESVMKGDYELVVRADVDGDGRIGLSDLVKLGRHFAEIEVLTGAKLRAADLNNTGTPSLTALVKISRHLAEIEEIK
jgi:subtilisin family serine protease